MLDTIEIKFAKHPTLGLDVFQKYLEEHPKSFRSTVGMLSAQSISKYGNPSICFYLSFPWHWSIQEPIVQELDGLKTSFYVTTKKWALKILQPKVVVISDATPKIIRWIRVNLPHTKIVSTRHGIAVGGKNFGLQAAAATDFICVSSESIKKDLCKRALLNQDQVWVTGFPQMDSLFKDANLGFNNSSFKSVTYAPTYDPKLSSIEVIGDNPVQWIRGNNQSINLTIRPHPHLFFYQPELMNRWKEIIRLENNVVLDDSPFSSLSALLNKTDLLISDVSSVALQFIALDKPIICVVDIEKAKLSDKFAPDEIEWKMHAGTKLVNRSVDLPSAVESSLIDGDSDSILAERSRIRKYLFGDMTDGNAGVRIAQRLTKLQAKCSVG